MMRPLGKEEKAEYGLDSPAAVVTIKTHTEAGGAQPAVLRVGAQDPADQSYVLHASGSAWVVRVNSYTVSSWISQTREGLLQVAATAAPTAGP